MAADVTGDERALRNDGDPARSEFIECCFGQLSAKSATFETRIDLNVFQNHAGSGEGLILQEADRLAGQAHEEAPGFRVLGYLRLRIDSHDWKATPG